MEWCLEIFAEMFPTSPGSKEHDDTKTAVVKLNTILVHSCTKLILKKHIFIYLFIFRRGASFCVWRYIKIIFCTFPTDFVLYGNYVCRRVCRSRAVILFKAKERRVALKLFLP